MSVKNRGERSALAHTVSMFSAISMVLLTASCKNQVTPAVPATPAPVPPQAATIEKPAIKIFAVEPGTLASGQTAILKWSISDAASIQIDNGIGPVAPDGTREIRPAVPTTYHLQARNEAGIVESTTSINVVKATAQTMPPQSSSATVEVAASQLQDIQFDYNDVAIARHQVLEQDAGLLRKIFLTDPGITVMIEGHCDERGSSEYNLGLGDQRAVTVKQALISFGLPALKLETVSFGKEHPVCFDATDECHARNRRAHFSLGR